MFYIIAFFIILIYASTFSLALKKRIEQVMPVSVVSIIIIIYMLGLLDNLKLGVTVIQILAIIQLIFILLTIIKKDKSHELQEIFKRIFTPGLLVYTILYICIIIMNKDRIFEDFDEFNHWAVIIKNMFMYNTFGTNPESVVCFNEYPPFTAVFQYLFLAIQKVYSEDTVIIAQSVLYLSIVIPITKNIKWNKFLIKSLTIVPLIMFVPLIFYPKFYLNILADAILGIMFAYTIYSAYEDEKNIKFKYMKILAGLLMLCLTKTSGLALAMLSAIIIFIKILLDRKHDKKTFKTEIKLFIIVCLIVAMLTSLWYIKVSGTKKRWNFANITKAENMAQKDITNTEGISKSFIKAIFNKEAITEREFTVFGSFLLCIAIQLILMRDINNKNYKYYSSAMLISIPIYLIGLLISYTTIFDITEAQSLASFDRYTSTILLGYVMLQAFIFAEQIKERYMSKFIITISILLAFMPMATVNEKYIDGENYKEVSMIHRNEYARLKEYINKLSKDDKILFVAGAASTTDYIIPINNYEIMPLEIDKAITGRIDNKEAFENFVSQYDYVFIYRMDNEDKENLRECFVNGYIEINRLYKVNKNENGTILEMERRSN